MRTLYPKVSMRCCPQMMWIGAARCATLMPANAACAKPGALTRSRVGATQGCHANQETHTLRKIPGKQENVG